VYVWNRNRCESFYRLEWVYKWTYNFYTSFSFSLKLPQQRIYGCCFLITLNNQLHIYHVMLCMYEIGIGVWDISLSGRNAQMNLELLCFVLFSLILPQPRNYDCCYLITFNNQLHIYHVMLCMNEIGKGVWDISWIGMSV